MTKIPSITTCVLIHVDVTLLSYLHVGWSTIKLMFDEIAKTSTRSFFNLFLCWGETFFKTCKYTCNITCVAYSGYGVETVIPTYVRHMFPLLGKWDNAALHLHFLSHSHLAPVKNCEKCQSLNPEWLWHVWNSEEENNLLYFPYGSWFLLLIPCDLYSFPPPSFNFLAPSPSWMKSLAPITYQ